MSDNAMYSFIIHHSSFITRGRVALLAISLAVVGCRKEDMSDQPKFYKPYKQTAQFADGTTARPVPEHTIPRGYLQLQTERYTGKTTDPVTGKQVYVDYIPIPITRADIDRGQQIFDISCAACHGKIGNGAGMVVTRGMPRPESIVRVDRPMTPREINVQRCAVGHYFDVITNGVGAMYSYDDKIAVDDRWRVVAYIKALQICNDADMTYVTMKPPATGAAPTPVQTDTTAPLPGQTGTPPRQPFTIQPATEDMPAEPETSDHPVK